MLLLISSLTKLLVTSSPSEDDTIDNSTHAFTSTLKQSEPLFVWEMYNSFTKLQQYVCFMLRLLLKHKHFRGPTDPFELAIEKDKLLFLAQSELLPVEIKQLKSGRP